MAMPMPLSVVAMGRMNGSASRATTRMATCMPRASIPSAAAWRRKPGSISPFTPSCTSTKAVPLMPIATSSRNSSSLRSFDGCRTVIAIDFVKVGRLSVGGTLEPLDDRQRVLEVVGVDGRLDGLPAERREVVERDVGLAVDARQRDGPDALLDALEDRDVAVDDADEVARLRVAVARDR